MIASRVKKLITTCLLHKDYITYQELANQLAISSRTINREIDILKETLHKYHLLLDVKKGKGIKIIGSQEDLDYCLYDMSQSTVEYMDKKERQELLSLELLQSTGISKTAYFSRKFQVSEATISNDIDEIEHDLKKYQLSINRVPGVGISINGVEDYKRQAMASRINKAIQEHLIHVDFDRYNVDDVVTQISATKKSTMQMLLDVSILKRIIYVFGNNKDTLDVDDMAKSSYIGLLIHLMIAIQRIENGGMLSSNQNVDEFIVDQALYQKAKMIASLLEQEFSIKIDDMEVGLITIHLQSAKQTVVDQTAQYSDYYHNLVMTLLSVFKQEGKDLLSDYDLYLSLLAHLKPAYVRLQRNLMIYNPMLQQIKENYKEIFELTQIACIRVHELYNLEFNDDEVAYLTLHFCAAIERQVGMEVKEPIKVGVVCSSGIGISAMMIAKIRKVVDQQVTLVALSIRDTKKTNCDLLFSTFDTENTIKLSILVDDVDQATILHHIERVRLNKKRDIEQKQNQSEVDLSELISICQSLLEDTTLHFVDSTIDKTGLITHLASLVTTDSLLVEQILKREEKGSNFYRNFHFALVHTTSQVVSKPVFKVIQSTTGNFIDSSLTGINVVLFMLLPQNPTTLQRLMLSHISSCLIEENVIQQFATCTYYQLQLIINKMVKQFMITILNGDLNE